ncbi:AAA family ATPase [Paenibacillus pini]|uniref:Bifunctional protein n=1 Tax=Paenibacillus pini JCM 16418 TaxID=1236976 RepID=W7YGF0_9BACL|nr:AAA family ATPase [Paenibacillus pini]GAF06618.1 bifunctional protein [Paenibacillus pini JCM 16418]
MIVMVNGAFGSGKTTTANMLHSRIENSMIFDPEAIGYMLRHIITDEIKLEDERTDDFQDLELWRILVVNTASELKKKYNKHFIVPMTLYKPHSFDYIYNGLQNIDRDLRHFSLITSEATIAERLLSRGDQENKWILEQNKKCAEALHNEKFAEHINTDQLSTEEIVDLILLRIGEFA